MSTSERRTGQKHHTPRRNHPLLSCYALFFLLCLFLLPIPTYAQEPDPTTWEWRTFTTDNSPLASNGVLGLLEDSQGRIWMRTKKGVSLYQQGIWQTFTAESSLLAPGEINALLEDSQGRIWAGTSYYDSDIYNYKSGVSFYQAGTWQTFTTDTSPLAPGGVRHLLEDSQRRIWVVTTWGLSFYQARGWQTFTSDNSSLATGWVNGILEDSQGHIWVGTEGGLSFYQAGQWQTFTADNSPLAQGEVQTLLEDSEGCIWVGTRHYDSKTDTNEGSISSYCAGTWLTLTSGNSSLASGAINVLLEDSQGRIWVGTEGGLSFYQARRWQTFTADDCPLVPGEIVGLLEDSQGRIWVVIHDWNIDTGSLSLYQAGTWQTFTTDNSPLSPGWVDVLLEDSQSRVWVGIRWGLSFYQARKWQTFTADNSSLAPGGVNVLLEDSQGRIWVGTWGGLSLCSAGVWETFTTDDSFLAGYGAWELLEDSKGRIWIGNGRGLGFYQAGTWRTFTSENSPLPPGGVRQLLEDSLDRVWVGADGGLSFYQAGKWRTFAADNSSLPPGGISGLLEDSQGRIWVGIHDWNNHTGGLSLYQAETLQTFTSDNSPLAPGGVWELLGDSQGRIWVSTDGGLSVYQAGTWQTFTSENSPPVLGEAGELLEDSQGRVWVGTKWGLSFHQAGVWQTFTSDNSLLKTAWDTKMMEDSRGRIWVSTERGLSFYQARKWQTFTANNSSLAPGNADVLLEDSHGRIWVGIYDWNTYTGGVSLYQTRTWQTFTADNSPLPPGMIQELLEDSWSRIWVGIYDPNTHTGGLSVYQADAWQTFTADNSSLAPGGVTKILENSQGRIWVGTERGISVHNPGDRPCAFLRYVGLTSGQTISLHSNVALALTSPSPYPPLVVGFSGVDTESDPNRLLFRCQLVGYEDEEVPCASPVRYAALPPGTYTFRVRALDEDLMSSEPATATITLISTAPLFERLVARLPKETVISLVGGLGGLAILAVCSTAIRSKVRRARRLAAWRKGTDPYIVGDVVEEPERFYGREEALTELLRALEAGNHVAVYGERRIGKTSLLHQLAHQLQDQPYSKVHFLPAFVSLQMVLESRFFYALANATARAAVRELEQKSHSPPSLRVDDRPEGYDSLDLADDLEVIVEALQETTGRFVRIVLLLDEADKMNGYDPHTQEALRGLLMTPIGGHVKLVWSGQTMNREWHLESSPWYNLFKQEIHLGGLKKEPAVRLIQEPVKGVFTYEDRAVERILELTGYKPYPIQRLCSLCVRLLLGENRFRATIDDVDTAWRDLQAEDARRAAEGATDLTYEPPRPARTVAEEGAEYHADKEKEP